MEGAPMLDTTTFVGLDVHARSIKAVSLDVMTGEVRAATFGYDAGAVAGWVRSVDPRARCVYESGVTGFDLQKRLSGLGVDCVVGAVSKMIKPSADRRRKNDRNDAEFLARMLSVGNVVEVWVPDDECEAARDLTRALEDARDDLSRSKQRHSFAAWVGLTPSEHSSGESDRRGAITKAGNKHLRKALVEAAWHYLTCSGRPKDLAKGQAPDRGARRHAAKGVRRLVERREALLARGVHNNKANVATARELACWVWAVGLMAEEA